LSYSDAPLCGFVIMLLGSILGVTTRRSKAIRVADGEGLQDCETLRLPHPEGSRLTDGGGCQHYAAATHYPKEDSCCSFLLRAE
jgi:hypothetical protein